MGVDQRDGDVLANLMLRFLADDEVFVWVDGDRLVIDGSICGLSDEEKEVVRRHQ